MAQRPWVTPEEVRAYSEIPSIKERSDAQLAIDITRAEQYIITYTHNNFEEYEEIPQEVKAAVIILAEAFARKATSRFTTHGLKSETFDDYSYTADDGTSIDFDGLGLAGLLDPWVLALPNCGVTLRLRRL